MKVALIFISVFIFAVTSQFGEYEEAAKYFLSTINNWNGTLNDLKQVLKVKLVEEAKKVDKEITYDEVEKYFKEFCKRFNSTLWTCEEYKRWELEEWGKLQG